MVIGGGLQELGESGISEIASRGSGEPPALWKPPCSSFGRQGIQVLNQEATAYAGILVRVVIPTQKPVILFTCKLQASGYQAVHSLSSNSDLVQHCLSPQLLSKNNNPSSCV